MIPSSAYSDLNGQYGVLRDYHIAKQHDTFARIYSDLQKLRAMVLKPKPKLRVDQAVDRYRYIPSEASANHGKFRTSTYEIGRGPCMAVTEPGVRIITVCGPTQLLKTTFLESTALYFMLIDPKPVIIIEPNEKSARDLSKTKIGGMINNTPALSKIIFDNTIERKAVPGGYLKITNAGSKTNLAQNAICISMCDETDKYELLDGSHPVTLAEKRTSSFGRDSRNLRVCSPEFERGFIWESYTAGDQRQPFVECPSCGHDHVMKWSIGGRLGGADPDKSQTGETRCVQWDIDSMSGTWDIDSARYVCPAEGCGHEWTQGDRLEAISKLRWRQTRHFTCCTDKEDQGGGYQRPMETRSWVDFIDESDDQHIVSYATCQVCKSRKVPNRHASFWTSRMYSPKHLSEMVAVWKEAGLSLANLKDFVNNELSEPWLEVKAIEFTADGLEARAETYDHEIPARAVILSAGVDVQDNRLEVEIVAWGKMGESWSIDYQVIPGDPKDARTWMDLDQVLGQEFVGADGLLFSVQGTCIDTGGHNTQAVYQYCLNRKQLNRWAIRGKSEAGHYMAPIWPKQQSYVGGFKLSLFEVGTTLAKTTFAHSLAKEIPGPQFCHFPKGRDTTWYQGLLGETQKMVNGVYRWRPRHDKVRNEPLDCRVYAMAALEGLKVLAKNPMMVERMAAELGITSKLTEMELTTFAKNMEHISKETREALEQGRAKPLKSRRAENDAFKPKRIEVDPLSGESVAQMPHKQLESQASGSSRPRPSPVAPSGRKPAPFRLR